MQRQRASRLEALHGVLNKEHFLGLVRSIALELGNICREVSELEEAEGRPMAKVCGKYVEIRQILGRFYLHLLGYHSGQFRMIDLSV